MTEQFRPGQHNTPAASPGMSEDEVKDYLQRKLGGSVAEVELSPEDINYVLKDTKRWFITRVGCKRYKPIRLAYQSGTYVMDPDVIEVLNMFLPTTHFPAIDTDDFSYTYSLMFGQWRAAGSTPMPYSDLVQRLGYLKDAQNIFSANRSFKYDPHTRLLDIMPAPSILGYAFVEVWSSNLDTRELQPLDEDLFLRFAVGTAKVQLGVNRAKYASLTTVGGDRALLAAQLKAEGQAEIEQAKKDSLRLKWAPSMLLG